MSRYCVLAMIVSAILFGDCPICWAQDAKKPAEDADLKALVEGNNEFAFDLYAQLAKKEGNVFFSPYSISTALGMTYAGARGNTAKEMAKTLHFTLDNDRLHPAFGQLIRKVNGPDKKRNYELTVANSLWGDRTNLTVNPKFLKITQDDYQAGLQLVDFAKDAEGARGTINGWVEDKTNKKIENLLPSGFIERNTRLVLVNAIYFKGEWATPFPKETTKQEDFTIPGIPPFKVPTMNRTFETNYMENDDFQLAEFMYKDNEVSMVVILPKMKDGLPDLEKKLSAKLVAQALATARPTYLKVSLPKVKMTESIRLEDDLIKLGIRDAFDVRADFSGMTQSESLRIAGVVHKGFLNVDEMGTEAAAANAVKMALKGGSPSPIPFHASHPFCLALRDNVTGGILFLGRAFDPREK